MKPYEYIKNHKKYPKDTRDMTTSELEKEKNNFTSIEPFITSEPTEVKTEIKICVDCYFYHHYGIESFNESQHLNDDEKQHVINSFKQILSGYTEPILFDIDGDCVDQYGIESESVPVDYSCSFSKEPCNICMSDLHGARYPIEINIGFDEVKNGKLWNLLTESFEYTFKKIGLEQ